MEKCESRRGCCDGLRAETPLRPFFVSKGFEDGIKEGASEATGMDKGCARVLEGAQIDVGHHYVAMSRKEFGLAEVQGYAPGAAPVSRGDDRAG